MRLSSLSGTLILHEVAGDFLCFILVIALFHTPGNYMFLKAKPVNGSLLDILGPYPWYIISLEVVAFVIFVVLWLVFKDWRIMRQNSKI